VTFNEGQPRSAPYPRSIGWTIVAWAAAVAVVYFVAQVLGLAGLGGWLGLAGFIIGGWFGGRRGGIAGRREWVVFGLMLLALAFVAIGLGSCAYAMALYG
jgi:MFS family permease